jgi:hypothetical protein
MVIGALGKHGEHVQKLVAKVFSHVLEHARILHQQMAGKLVPVILPNLETVEIRALVNIYVNVYIRDLVKNVTVNCFYFFILQPRK